MMKQWDCGAVRLSLNGHPLSISKEARLSLVQDLRYGLRLDPRPDHPTDELNRGKGWFEDDYHGLGGFPDVLLARLLAMRARKGTKRALELEASDGTRLLVTLAEEHREGTIADG